MRKKVLSALLALTMCATLLVGCSGGSKETTPPATTPSTQGAPDNTAPAAPDYSGVELVVCTWGGTTGDATKKLAEDFEKKYGCTIVIDGINANSDRLAKLQSQIQSGVVEDDVVYFSGAYAKQAEKLGLFEKIDTSVVTNISELYDFALNDTGYGPMVLVGRFGIMYNEDILKEKGLEPPTSYMELFDDKYAGLVSLPAMTATAGPYVLIAIAEQLGGGIDNYQPALDLYKEKKDNIKLWYTTDLMAALSQKEVAITVYMDLMLPVLVSSGLNMKWVDAKEGNFADDVFINVVKDSPNKELAQLFVNYALEKSTQELFIELNNEAPTNKNAQMSEEKQAFLAYGQEDFDKCTFFDYDKLNAVKPEMIEQWQKIAAQ